MPKSYTKGSAAAKERAQKAAATRKRKRNARIRAGRKGGEVAAANRRLVCRKP